MKKVLFATTALVAFAGAASADVAISGLAEMGIADTSPAAGVVDATDTGFFTSVDVYFDMTGETDNGLSFGASIDLDDAGGTVDEFGNAFADYQIFISGGFGTLTIGDTDGALDWAMTEAGNVGNGGSLADDETVHAGYLGSYGDGAGDNTVLRYDNTFGDFGVAVSVEQSTTLGVSDNETGFALGVKYNIDLGGTTVALGAGFQNAVFDGASGYGPVGAAFLPAGSEADIFGVSAGATFGAFKAGLTFTSHDFENAAGVAIADIDHIGLGVSYSTGALTLHANYGEFDGTTTAAFLGGAGPVDAEGYGLSAKYDLGGGASAHFGYGTSDIGGVDAGDSWSLGLAMSF